MLAVIISLICIVVFLLQSHIPMNELILIQSKFKIWQLFTYMFLHASFSHLFYNIFALVMFGSILEKLVGSKNFLVIYLFSGIASGVTALFFYNASLGASGAIFGVIGVLTYLRPKLIVFIFGAPMPLIIASFFWILIDFVGIFYPDSVAHLSHITGFFIGLLFATQLKKFKEKKRRRYKINDKVLDEWESKYMSVL